MDKREMNGLAGPFGFLFSKRASMKLLLKSTGDSPVYSMVWKTISVGVGVGVVDLWVFGDCSFVLLKLYNIFL